MCIAGMAAAVHHQLSITTNKTKVPTPKCCHAWALGFCDCEQQSLSVTVCVLQTSPIAIPTISNETLVVFWDLSGYDAILGAVGCPTHPQRALANEKSCSCYY